MHIVEAFVARETLFRTARAELPGVAVVSLSQGFALLPNTKALSSALPPGALSAMPTDYSLFERLSPPLLEWALALSNQGALVYFETEYFGGVGGQRAIVWNAGRPSWGPAEAPGGPINAALSTLGVVRQGELDEFDSIGLGRHRTTNAWARGP